MSIRKIMVAAWAALGAGWALADAPSVTEVNMTQLADKTVVITYKLANGPRSIYYGGALYPPEDRFEITDGEYVAAVKARL